MSGDFFLCGKLDRASMGQQTLEYPGLKLSSENWADAYFKNMKKYSKLG